MANKLKVQEHEAILNLNRLGWGIRRIARELGVSRNTVRGYVRNLESSPVEAIVQEVLRAAPDPAGAPGTQTDPLSTPGSGSGQNQTDPLATSGNNGRKGLCADHAGLITTKVEAGLSAQRIYQDLRNESSFGGSYQSVKRYVRQLRQSDPELVQRIEVEPAGEVQVDFGTGPTLLEPDNTKRKTSIFRIVLSYSRKAYSEAVLRQDTGTFLRCLENAFRAFGGSTLTINTDNLKAAVISEENAARLPLSRWVSLKPFISTRGGSV